MKATLLFLTLCAVTISSAQQQQSAFEWIIDPAGTQGIFSEKVTEADLVKRIGAENIARDSVNIGEGFYEQATILFPADESKKLTIIWMFMPDARSPREIRLRGSQSMWKLTNGITLGTTLKELEAMNGKAFTLAGMDWDYQGTVLDWKDGRLAADLINSTVRLAAPPNTSLSEQESRGVSGDKEFSSGNKTMQKLNPVVYEIIIRFGAGPT